MKEKKQSLKSKVTYVKKNWMLYIFFLMPALLLTIIFKYVPMGGLLIAFKDYNVIKGVLGSPWVGLEYFKRFLSSPDFMNYLMNTLKVSIYGLLWGISGTDHTCTASESYSQRGHQEKDTASDLRTKFYLSYCTLWYGSYVFITNRTYEQAARYQHKLDDNAGCIQDNLHSERHLAGSRLGFNHVYSGIIQCEQGA